MGFISVSAGFATSAMLAISAGFGDIIGLSVSDVSNIKGVEIAFKFSKDN